MKPVLQVALDLVHGDRAIEIARDAVKGGVDWIEAGTPLIKSEGMEIVRLLKKTFPTHTVVADMKTIDVGGAEVEMAAKSGADVVVILGISSDPTITEAILSARQYGSKVMVDLFNVRDKEARAKEIERMGADYICIHVGVDEQMVGGTPLSELKGLVDAVNIPIAAAGGINSETAPDVVRAGASIIIVGGAIIKAKDVTKAARNVKKAITSGKKVKTELFKKYSEKDLFTAFSKVSSPNVADAQHKKGAMKGIHPRIAHGVKMVGKALTVHTINGDWAKPVEAIDRAKPGDIIVIDACGGEIAVWGELASWSCKTKGVTGVVIDGAARDIDSIIELGFPCFSRYIASNAGEPKGYGGIGHEIVCGGITVKTGDWIIGDESGVVVIPQESAVEVANRALDVLERENRLREEIKKGGTLSSVMKLEKWEKVG
ncbi:MAG: bifunctional hexulose-6-phosphate synthase/ribonuclease regulator [Euryarchaeota archaeon RBG_19FT_COMBO_56_21]|nr:MAG: bifunctional hexulose-6-phosphate synthase/ribonuclease regulator [Euryarchaeota archaeon RBG_19FT_COMBO_56_21]